MEREVRSFCRIGIANYGIIATVEDATREPTVVKVNVRLSERPAVSS
jgi:hypothetical protein